MNMILQSARHLPGSSGLGFQGTCFQQSLMGLVPLSKKTFPHLTLSILVPGNLLESIQYGMTVV